MAENSIKEDLGKVIAEMEQKCVEKPGSVMAHHHLGLVYRKAGRLDEAVAALEKAIELDPFSVESLINLGALYFDMGNVDKAQAVNERNLELLAQTTATDLLRHCQATPDIQVDSLDDFVAFLKSDWAAFPDSVVTIQQMVAEEDRVAVVATYEGTQTGPMGPFPANGKWLSLDFIAVFRIDNDKIAEIWVTWDNLAALSQLGHFPPPQ